MLGFCEFRCREAAVHDLTQPARCCRRPPARLAIGASARLWKPLSGSRGMESSAWMRAPDPPSVYPGDSRIPHRPAASRQSASAGRPARPAAMIPMECRQSAAHHGSPMDYPFKFWQTPVRFTPWNTGRQLSVSCLKCDSCWQRLSLKLRIYKPWRARLW